MKKAICVMLVWISVITAGGFCEAFTDDVPTYIFIIQILLCFTVAFGALVFGRLWEYGEDEDKE